MDKSAKTPTPWSFPVWARPDYDLDFGIRRCGMRLRVVTGGLILAETPVVPGCSARQGRDGCGGQRRLGGGGEDRFAFPHPSSIARLARGCAIGSCFEDLLVAEWDRFWDIQYQARRIPPYDRRSARDGAMQAGFDRTAGRYLTLRTPIEHGVRAEGGTARGG